jgi:GNAT superfamily N-acetyltransferase
LDDCVVSLTAEHCADAGALLAARHKRERRRFPLLPAGPEDAAVAASLVAGTLRFAEGVALLDERGDLAGFLTAVEQTTDPASPMARYSPRHASLHLVHAHAVAADTDAGRAYALLFGELAARMLTRGVIDHVAHVPIGDPATEAAWVGLGFGRVNVVAIRDLASTSRTPPADVEVRAAGVGELDVVDALVDEESIFHAASPIFRPYVREQTSAAVRAQLAADLASDDHAVLVARHDGRDVGVLCIGPGLGSPLYVPDAGAYIGPTAVLPAARRLGVGGALVNAAFSWAAKRGYRAACLHMATANVTSVSFWTGIGFVPVMAHMRRRLDDRILTCRPPSDA